MSTDSPLLRDLVRAYDADVIRRNDMTPAPWRIEILQHFEHRMGDRGSSTMIELGCGTGQLAEHMGSLGWRVEAIDLSPANVDAAIARGVSARAADFADLPYPDGTFGAAYAINSLLHVPRRDLPDVYTEIRRVLVPGALLLVVVWGGVSHEGPLEGEWLDPPRYFSLYLDSELLEIDKPGFEVVEFTTRDDTGEADLHAQVLTLRAI